MPYNPWKEHFSPKAMQLIDTHAHPHMDKCDMPPKEYMEKSKRSGVVNIVCVGTNTADSRRAIEFAEENDCVASVGLHPHEASEYENEFRDLRSLPASEKVVAVGECGLDYYYENSPRDAQLEALHAQINLSKKWNLPLIFHIRDGANIYGETEQPTAFGDFLEVFDMHQNIYGVVHSFTGNEEAMQACVERGLYIGLNGIMTFTKNPAHITAAKTLPLGNMVLETDAPFLTPRPYRGTINYSAHVRTVAEFLGSLRGETVEEIAHATTLNARDLFGL